MGNCYQTMLSRTNKSMVSTDVWMKESVGVGRVEAERNRLLWRKLRQDPEPRKKSKKQMVKKRKIGGKELPQEKAKPCNILGELARNPSPSVWTSGSAQAEWAQCLSPLLQVSLK